ncbi:MAG TPA: cobalamin-binding protein [Candidatus Xenobia bacterium]|nr:cobalamin-binding protein [Candidatus Xenobia bacterium]
MCQRIVALIGLLAAFPLATQAQRTVVDETGRTVRVPARVERVISLAPNVTEILYALGLEDRLVAVTNQCDQPPAARTKPKVGDVANPSLETLLALQPDLVIGTTLGNPREIVGALEQAGIPLYGVDPRSVTDIFVSIRHVADLLGVPERGEQLAAGLEAQLAGIEQRAAGGPQPRVLFVIWLEPLITVGSDTFLNDVLRRAGAQSVTAGTKESWPRLSLETVIESNPDYLVLPRIPAIETRLAEVRRQPAWRSVRARVIWLDEAVLRPGPRIVDALDDLARQLHSQSPAPEARR